MSGLTVNDSRRRITADLFDHSAVSQSEQCWGLVPFDLRCVEFNLRKKVFDAAGARFSGSNSEGFCVDLNQMRRLLIYILGYIKRCLKRPPRPPYFVIYKVHAPCLELDSDGSYESCLQFLSTLETQFGAEYSEHLEAGPRPHAHKEKGYWNVQMFGQDFFVMRRRGYGLCIWGPKPPEELTGCLRIAEHFGAVEYLK